MCQEKEAKNEQAKYTSPQCKPYKSGKMIHRNMWRLTHTVQKMTHIHINHV